MIHQMISPQSGNQEPQEAKNFQNQDQYFPDLVMVRNQSSNKEEGVLELINKKLLLPR